MSRLPAPGSDADIWGGLLNDFLLREHNIDGSLKIRNDLTAMQTRIDGTVPLASKGQPNGYTPLDDSAKVPSAYLPLLADQLQVAGVVGNGVTDDGPAIQTALEGLSSGSLNRSFEVVVQAPTVTGVVYINQIVIIKSNNTLLRFRSPVLFGPVGGLRIQGELDETPAINKPFITLDAAAGSTTIKVNNGAFFSVGDFIVIRGARDGSGNSLQKMTNTITAISGNTLTLAKALDDTFLVFNPGAWSNHNSNVTKVVAARISSGASRGSRVIPVDSSSLFAVGDIVQILDDTNTSLPVGTLEITNFKHKEIAEIREVVSPTSVRISHALHHTYNTAQSARIARVVPVKHSSISDVAATWAAMSTTNYALEIKYAVSCRVTNCQVIGDSQGGKSWLNQAIRLTDSYFSEVTSCSVAAPAVTGSGQGYGVTLYGATHCAVRDCRISSARHSVLFFSGAAGNTVSGCTSVDCAVSDYDLHGAECVDNLVSGCVAVGGDSVASDGSTSKAACRVGNTSHVDGDFYNVFTDMQIINYPGIAFDVVPQSSDNVLRGSRVMNAQVGVKLVPNSSNTALLTSNIYVENTDFVDVATLTQVDGGTSSTVRGLIIENCRFVRSAQGLSITNAQKAHLRRNAFFDPAFSAGTYAVVASNVTQFSAKQNDISNTTRGVKLTTCVNARVVSNIMHDLGETTVYEDAGGNTGALFARNDIFGFAPATAVSGSGPSTGGVVDIGVLYQPDTPLRHSFLEWNFDPIALSAGSGSTSAAGIIYLMKITAQSGGVVNNIVTTVGSLTTPSLTSGQNFAGIYDNTGTRIGVTTDQATAWSTAGLKSMALTGPVTIQAGRDYFVALVANGSVLPSFVSSAGGATTSANSNLSNSQQRFSTNGSGTALPASVTLSSNSGVGAKAYWAALS